MFIYDRNGLVTFFSKVLDISYLQTIVTFDSIHLFTLLIGEASIVSSSKYPFTVDSKPAGATVIITDKFGKEYYSGKSPATMLLKAGAGFFNQAQYEVKISAPGYAEKTIPIVFKINGWYFGNILLWGLIGMLIVDPATGAMWKLATPDIDVTLSKSNAMNESPSLKIVDIASIPQNMKGQLVRMR